MKKPTLKERVRLMEEAIERYLRLCGGNGDGVCECGEHADDCPLIERPCLPDTGGLCHWCHLDAASLGVNYMDIEASYHAKLTKESTPA